MIDVLNGRSESLNPEEALKKVIESAAAKFSESIDVVVNLNIDSRKSNEHVKGVVVLPKGLGKDVKIAVFAKDKNISGLADGDVDVLADVHFIEEVLKGNEKLNVDWCITTPEFMPHVSTLAKIIGPKGLMPNPKYGTVTSDIVGSVRMIRAGQIKFSSDRNGCVHAKIGNIGFSLQDVLENYNVFINNLKKLKPSSIKGNYFKSIFVNSTMGKSFKVVNVS